MKLSQRFLSMEYSYRTAGYCQQFLLPAVIAFFTVGVIWGLFIAPSDFQQGQGYRIIYIHVPSAVFAMGIYTFMGTMAVIFLVWRIKLAAIVMQSCAHLGVAFAFLALATGSIWGKPMWGAWWVWDARLTSALILFFLYLGLIALQNALQATRQRDMACSVLVLVGLINIPIMHYSVAWWNTLHQGATITRFGAPSMAPSMLLPLIFMLITFGIYSALTLCWGVRCEILVRECGAKWVRAIA